MSFVPEFIYGGIDGVITTFAIVSGVAGAELPLKIIVILGLANVFADGFSMGVSSYLSEGARGSSQPLKSSLVTFLSFIAMGTIPILPFILIKDKKKSYFISYFVTALLLFFIGTAKGTIKHGMESLFLGGTASLISFYIGNRLKNYHKEKVKE